MTCLKFTTSTETHRRFKFRTGLNTDTNSLAPDPTKLLGTYGLYFTDIRYCARWLAYDMAYVREVTLPKGELVVNLDGQYRSHRIILGPRYDLYKVKTWKWLVSKGFDNANDALRWATVNGDLEVAKYLVALGADVTAYDNLAVCNSSYFGHLEMVKYLVSQGADVTARKNYALRWASANGDLDVVEYLVSQGADVTACNNHAVHLANEYGHLDVVKFLESKGAVLPL